ncbi:MULTISPECIES: hypothetical protein [unclassified Lonepinella]
MQPKWLERLVIFNKTLAHLQEATSSTISASQSPMREHSFASLGRSVK